MASGNVWRGHDDDNDDDNNLKKDEKIKLKWDNALFHQPAAWLPPFLLIHSSQRKFWAVFVGKRDFTDECTLIKESFETFIFLDLVKNSQEILIN